MHAGCPAAAAPPATAAPTRCRRAPGAPGRAALGARRGGLAAPSRRSRRGAAPPAQRPAAAAAAPRAETHPPAPTDVLYDAVVVGAGMGGLATAAALAARGARVVVLEKYVVPGGSAAAFRRGGFTFDVGSSMMFGFGDAGTTNLMTRALAAVGKRLPTVPDPTQIHYHLPASAAHPRGLEVKVWRRYEDFVAELARAFPAERAGIEAFYGECWRVFNALNALELKSLEEPRYLLGEFAKHPGACLTLASFLATNAGDVARRHIRDPELLRFIDVECYCWSTVDADFTPMINAGMVFCDRHFGGINYPVGGVGEIPDALAAGIRERGGHVELRAPVRRVLLEPDAARGGAPRAAGVELADGRVYRGRAVVSNATRWDTFGGAGDEPRHRPLVPAAATPPSEAAFRRRYKKAPSFFSVHAGIEAGALPAGTECHHIVVEDWAKMEDPFGTLFVSIPSLLDPSVCPPGTHVFHAFTPDWVDSWAGLGPAAYKAKKEAAADGMFARLEAALRLAPGALGRATVLREVGTPRTHRRFLGRADGSYGPIPARRPAGMLGMPFNRTAVPGLYCVGDSTFPGQGVNAVVFSGFGCAHRVAVDLGMEPGLPGVDEAFGALLAAVRDAV